MQKVINAKGNPDIDEMTIRRCKTDTIMKLTEEKLNAKYLTHSLSLRSLRLKKYLGFSFMNNIRKVVCKL